MHPPGCRKPQRLCLPGAPTALPSGQEEFLSVPSSPSLVQALSPTVLAQLCCPGASCAQSHRKSSPGPTATRGPGSATGSVPRACWASPKSSCKMPKQTSAGTVAAVTADNQRKAATGSHLQPGHLWHCQLQLPPTHSQLPSHLPLFTT